MVGIGAGYAREYGLETTFEIISSNGETRTPGIVWMQDNGHRVEPYYGVPSESVIDIT